MWRNCLNYINRFNYPDSLLRVIKNDPYSKGDSDFSATGLLSPPRATVLIEKHSSSLEIDIYSRIASLIGQGVHSVLERAQRQGDLIEKRFFGVFVINDIEYTVSAQIDLYESDTRTLSDWKTTKAFAFHKKNSAKPEWIAQMNIGAYLMELDLLKIDHLQIIGILKDWDKKKAQQEPGYPPTEVMVMPIERWTKEKTELFIKNRITRIIEARKELPQCSPREMWGGRKCQDWCDAASVCTQWKQIKTTGIIGATNAL